MPILIRLSKREAKLLNEILDFLATFQEEHNLTVVELSGLLDLTKHDIQKTAIDTFFFPGEQNVDIDSFINELCETINYPQDAQDLSESSEQDLDRINDELSIVGSTQADPLDDNQIYPPNLEGIAFAATGKAEGSNLQGCSEVERSIENERVS